MVNESEPLLSRTGSPPKRRALLTGVCLTLCAGMGWLLVGHDTDSEVRRELPETPQVGAVEKPGMINICSRANGHGCNVCAASKICGWCAADDTCHVAGSVLAGKCWPWQRIGKAEQCPQIQYKDYNEPDAESMWMATTYAYCHKVNIVGLHRIQPRCRTGLGGDFVTDGLVEGKSSQHSFAYVGHSDSRKEIVVSFRGILDSGDTLKEANSFSSQKKYWNRDPKSVMFTDECTLHSLNGVKFLLHSFVCMRYTDLNTQGTDPFDHSQAQPLEALVERVAAKYPDYAVTFTGHNLGGSIASVQALTFALTTGRRPRLVTFGQPRTGDSTFAKAVETHVDSHRLVHGGDVVPQRPRCCCTHGEYCDCNKDSRCPYHHGREVWYPKSMFNTTSYPKHVAEYTVCEGGEDRRCSDGLLLSNDIDRDLEYFGTKLTDCCFLE